MSKKRGPNSPNESEKLKTKPSAAATTLSMASMLSVVSGAFSGQGASSIVSDTDSDEENPTLTQPGSVQDGNVWTETNLNRSQVRSPKRTKEPLEPLFTCFQDGAMRDEIVVEILSKNKKKFTGTITPIEAKHSIYIKGLGFANHDNFDGVRINWKGKLIVTFKLIQPINIDELDAVEHFDFTRVSSVNGKRIEETIGCKVKGVRYRPISVGPFDDTKPNDGTKVVKIEGCEYRITKEEIIAWLTLYGEPTSNLEEDCFRDAEESGGNNRTGNYSIMMKLNQNIPQLLPMCGRRIKIYHAGIQKLCTNCFGEHKKQHCESQVKVPWINYVDKFIEENEWIPKDYFGRWTDLVAQIGQENPSKRWSNNTRSERNEPAAVTRPESDEAMETPTQESSSTQEKETSNKDESPKNSLPEVPTKESFDIPTTDEAYNLMVDRFATIGMTKGEVDDVIKARNTAYNRACREHKKLLDTKANYMKPNSLRKGRKNSLNKQ